MKRFLPLWVLFTAFSVWSQDINVVFVGIMEGAGPSFENRYSELVREKLQVRTDMHLVDYADTRRLMSMVNFYTFPHVSSHFQEKLSRYMPDSSLFVWGRVKDFDIQSERKGLFGARVVGTVSIVLTMYSLNYKEYAFVGSVEGRAEVKKTPVGFHRVDKYTHITASDRVKITDDLSRQAAIQTENIVQAVVRNRLFKEGPVVVEDVQDEEDQPSIFDVLEIPSADAPPVEGGENTSEPEEPLLPGFGEELQ